MKLRSGPSKAGSLWENLNQKEFDKVVNKIKFKHENYDWANSEDPVYNVKWVGTYTGKDMGFSHRIIITVVNYKNYQVEIANEIKGEKWGPKNVKTTDFYD